MNEIFITAKPDGTIVPFVADTLFDARRKAIEVAGPRYRFITVIHSNHREFVKYKKQLGL